MDSNGLPIEGFPLVSFPTGFGLALASNAAAQEGFSRLTEAEKEHLLLRCKDAKSREEMDKIVSSLVDGESAASVLQQEKEEIS